MSDCIMSLNAGGENSRYEFRDGDGSGHSRTVGQESGRVPGLDAYASLGGVRMSGHAREMLGTITASEDPFPGIARADDDVFQDATGEVPGGNGSDVRSGGEWDEPDFDAEADESDDPVPPGDGCEEDGCDDPDEDVFDRFAMSGGQGMDIRPGRMDLKDMFMGQRPEEWFNLPDPEDAPALDSDCTVEEFHGVDVRKDDDPGLMVLYKKLRPPMYKSNPVSDEMIGRFEFRFDLLCDILGIDRNQGYMEKCAQVLWVMLFNADHPVRSVYQAIDSVGPFFSDNDIDRLVEREGFLWEGNQSLSVADLVKRIMMF